MTKKEVAKLKEELKHMTQDRDSSIQMYRRFLETSMERGKAIDILLPLINTEHLITELAKYSDMKKEINKLKQEKKYLFWSKKKGNEGKGWLDYLWSLAD